jgi:hypothetical protein
MIGRNQISVDGIKLQLQLDGLNTAAAKAVQQIRDFAGEVVRELRKP